MQQSSLVLGYDNFNFGQKLCDILWWCKVHTLFVILTQGCKKKNKDFFQNHELDNNDIYTYKYIY